MTFRAPNKSSFGDNGSPYKMFFASLLLHLIVIAAFIITVPGTSKQLTFGAPYSVALVGPEVMQSPQKASAPKDIMQPSQPAPPVILKRKPVAIKAVPPIKKTDTSQRDIEKAINAIRQKERADATRTKKSIEKAINAIRQKERTDATGTQTGKAPYPGAAPSAEYQAQIDDYSNFVWLKIKKNWTLPAALMPKNNIETIIDVRIAQSGSLEYIGFEKRSGNSYFDESALRAVKKSVPFPPLTGWVNSRSIEIGIRFHSAELR